MRELEARSNQVAHLLRKHGLKRGDTISVFMHNAIDYLPICWGAQRSGIVFVAIATKLTAAEVGYIIEDSGHERAVRLGGAGRGGDRGQRRT